MTNSAWVRVVYNRHLSKMTHLLYVRAAIKRGRTNTTCSVVPQILVGQRAGQHSENQLFPKRTSIRFGTAWWKASSTGSNTPTTTLCLTCPGIHHISVQHWTSQRNRSKRLVGTMRFADSLAMNGSSWHPWTWKNQRKYRKLAATLVSERLFIYCMNSLPSRGNTVMKRCILPRKRHWPHRSDRWMPLLSSITTGNRIFYDLMIDICVIVHYQNYCEVVHLHSADGYVWYADLTRPIKLTAESRRL